MNCKIFEITHKKCFYPAPDDYVPIQVGKINTKIDLGYINDDSGENIAQKNSNYCELTAWYWLSKNYDLPEYVGLCHYRRFFVQNRGVFSGGSDLLTSSEIVQILKQYDIILPQKIDCGMTVKEFYYLHGEGKKKDIEAVEQIIIEKYPEYKFALEKVLNDTQCSYWNLAVFKKEDYLAYCDWLFNILFELENRIDISNYTAPEARIFGYLSEILINVWVEYNGLRIYRSAMIFVDNNKLKNRLRRFRAMIVNERLKNE